VLETYRATPAVEPLLRDVIQIGRYNDRSG
jgi:hypothetical protein